MATKPDEYPRARVIEVDGQLVLDDPDAVAVIRAVERHNLEGLLEVNGDRIEHFRSRAKALGEDSKTTVIVVLIVDDPNGRILADLLMPGHDWQAIRDRGEIPVARGLAFREGIVGALSAFDEVAAKQLETWDSERLAVVAVDQGVAGVF